MEKPFHVVLFFSLFVALTGCTRPKETSPQKFPGEKKFAVEIYDTRQGKVELRAESFTAGNVVWLHWQPRNIFYRKVLIEVNEPKKSVSLTRKMSSTWLALPLLPEEESWKFRVNGRELLLKINKCEFPVYHRQMRLGKFSSSDFYAREDVKERLKKESEFKKQVLAQIVESEQPIDFHFSAPVKQVKITSPFYALRSYERLKKVNGRWKKLPPSESRHSGLDFGGKVGTPIYAIGAGRVVLAREFLLQGNYIIIDHGGGLSSEYMHLSKLKVKEGDLIERGAEIGLLGKTGRVTGPHLHLGVRVNGYLQDPESLY